MARQLTRGSWINSVGRLFGGTKKAKVRLGTVRRLAAEFLEDRNVMSVAPLGDVSDLSLAEYLAQEHQMGPIAPAEVAGDIANSAPVASVASGDHLMLRSLAEGEGDDGGGDDGTGGDGTGGDGTGGDGTGGDGTGGDGTGGDGTGGDGTGGDGTGSDGGDASDDDGMGDPTIDSTEVTNDDGTTTITGFLSDDGGVGNLTLTLDNGTGDFQLNDDGSFTLNVTDSGGNSTFTISVTDDDGNTTTYTFDYPI